MSFGEFFQASLGPQRDDFSRQLIFSDNRMPWLLLGNGAKHESLRNKIIAHFSFFEDLGTRARRGEGRSLAILAILAKIATVELAAALMAAPKEVKEFLNHDISWPVIVGFSGKMDKESLANLRRLGFGSSIWGKKGVLNTDINCSAHILNIYVRLIRSGQYEHGDVIMQKKITGLEPYSTRTRDQWQSVAKELIGEVQSLSSDDGKPLLAIPQSAARKATWRRRFAIAFGDFAIAIQSADYPPSHVAD